MATKKTKGSTETAASSARKSASLRRLRRDTKRAKTVKRPATKLLYMCGVDWQHEIGQARDLEGRMPLYSDVETLKKTRSCWVECGIVEVEVKLTKWVSPQDLFGKEKS